MTVIHGDRVVGMMLTAIVVLLAAGSLSAHHSFSAVFDASKPVSLTGTLTQVDWRNPHIAFSLEAKVGRDQAEPWEIEAGPPNFFRSRNIGKSDFEKAIGQTITVEALRAKNGSRFGSLLKITFPNGRSITSSLGA